MDKDQEIYLQSLQTRIYIFQKLRKLKNNTPGTDKIEYIHLKLIYRSGLLMVSILGAVHKLGISKLWKENKVTLIYKKGHTNDPSNFSQICLLNTMYILYSRMLRSKLIHISKEKICYC